LVIQALTLGPELVASQGGINTFSVSLFLKMDTILAVERSPCCAVTTQKARAAMYSPAQKSDFDEAYTSFKRTTLGLRPMHARFTVNVNRSLLTTAKSIKYGAFARVIVLDGGRG
jgi:hypothetical protein